MKKFLALLPFTLFLFACSGTNTTGDLTQTGSGEIAAGSGSVADETAAKQIVIEFGTKMKAVSLLAGSGTVLKAMDDNYGNLVTPDLLSAWKSKPSIAPGRMTSSPWPDHINVTAVTPMDDQTMIVSGNVVEMTSEEVAHGGYANMYPVRIVVVNQNGAWRIAAFMKQ
ncbi:MAG TPA: hypothetical protein VHA78_06015 [Candidatus Peribacteraceae bacterium]|nr:hypothetical protein [Candidatus Peribacteraceae bacterium]